MNGNECRWFGTCEFEKVSACINIEFTGNLLESI